MNFIHVSQKGMLMSISKFETLAKVCELGSLTKAAEVLGCTQSAVSHTINSLEEQFGFAILTRSRAGVKLTDDGQRIMPSVRGMLNYYEQLNQTVSAIRGLDFGTVRIGAFTSVAVHWLPGVIKEFLRLYPCRTQRLVCIVVRGLQQRYERLGLALDERKLRVRRKFVIRRQNGQQLILHERYALAVEIRRQVHEAEVNAALGQPLFDIVVVAV